MKQHHLVRHNLVSIRKESSQYLYQNLLPLIQDRKLRNQTKKQKKANYYKHKMKSGENISWTANIQNGDFDTMDSFSINFDY